MAKGIFKRACTRICDNRAFIAFGTVVTIWALFGDDIRLWATDKPADPIFDGVVISVICFFSFEICVSIIGKVDYFPGFFFGLDVFSTATLVLDLSVVSDRIFDSGGDADKARGSRTARLGARVGRVVRVLRLFRIVKLFKVVSSARARPTPKKAWTLEDMESMDWDEDQMQAEQPLCRESMVGKKLSLKTMQRTIILVLSLLIVLPVLSMSAIEKVPPSASLGAIEVFEAFRQLQRGKGTREQYEQVFLRYVYYHNWFKARTGCDDKGGCSAWSYSHLFWAGIAGKASTADLQGYALTAQLSTSQVELFDWMASTQDDLYNYGTMPREVRRLFYTTWSTQCSWKGFEHWGFSVLQVDHEQVKFKVECPHNLRKQELEKYVPQLLMDSEYKNWHMAFYFDLRPYVRQEAGLSVVTTIFVCIVLCVASILFSNDANKLVITPVENMIYKLEAIQEDPLKAMNLADDEVREEHRQKMQQKKHHGLWKVYELLSGQRSLCVRQEKEEMLETVILEKTIIKLASLLALGFGQAGANIVSQNMKGTNTTNVNAMIAGQRVECIIGLARIRDFSTATEVLQEKVMKFVNQIAEIVHGVVDEFHGSANKNNGDTFLLIWRTAGLPEKKVTRLADMSVMAFAKILGGVHRSMVLADYRTHPGLQQRLQKGCRVHLTFGLHCGWAIEGAVGSEYKFDASYLSPNVRIAESIEHATRIYGVSIVASQAVIGLCTKDMASHVRVIDQVKLKGLPTPMELMCLDLDYLALQVDEPLRKAPMWNQTMSLRSRKYLQERKAQMWKGSKSITHLFKDDPAISTMRHNFSAEFIEVFRMGYQNYSQGEWQVARQLLEKTQSLLCREDGPSGALLSFMGQSDYEAPEGWDGVRNLGDVLDL